jgi:hypothetical protein
MTSAEAQKRRGLSESINMIGQCLESTQQVFKNANAGVRNVLKTEDFLETSPVSAAPNKGIRAMRP